MWFSASLLFKASNLTHTEREGLWEESVFLIEAENEVEARTIANDIGKRQEHEYEIADGTKVRWIFSRVEQIYELLSKNITSGTEIFSRFLSEHSVKSMREPFKDE
jgi:hypothetical protein